MKEIIERYIKHMIEKHKIIAAMVSGSYVTGEMCSNSDIDIFFIWEKEFESMRGREYFEGVEFEYFISPEWKYYDRLRTDKTSMRIYSSSQILFDHNNIIKKIQETAAKKIRNYSCDLSVKTKKDYKFWLETICSDGKDLFDNGDYYDFIYFTGVNLQKMSDLLCKINNVLPPYEKYGVKELEMIDEEYYKKLKKFLSLGYNQERKKELWVKLCKHIDLMLGELNITNYETHQKL